MAREISFPKTRHVALFENGPAEEAKAAGCEAILVPIREAAQASAPVGMPLPLPVEKGAPGVPEKGALPAAAPVEGLAAGMKPPAPQTRALPWVVVADISVPSGEADRCRSIDGSPSQIRCASSLEGRDAANALAARAALLGDAVLLDGLDRWYRAGREAAGFCRSCELSLVEYLRESYGEHLQPFDALEPLRNSALPPPERPFALQKEALRFSEAIEAAKRAILRTRDEARRSRSLEMAVLGRVGPLSALALELCRHLDGLIFELPIADPHLSLLPLLAARAALGQRPSVAALPADISVTQLRLFASLAAACDTDIVLAADASSEAKEALAKHRAFLALVRERYRPSSPLVDAEVLLSARADHLTGGAHQRAAALCVAALAKAQFQVGVRLDLSGSSSTRLLVVPGTTLPQSDATAARRHVEGGGDLLLLGKALPADEEGRTHDPLFPEVKSGLDRVGDGRVYILDDAPSEAQLIHALRELAGRSRPQISLSGRGKLWARAYLDPERKLDVHLVNLDVREGGFSPAQGVQAQIAGQAAGGGRAGYWFAPERDGGKDGERIQLNPSGFSVSTILPSVDSYALLALPR